MRAFSKIGNMTSLVGQTKKESETSFMGQREYFNSTILHRVSEDQGKNIEDIGFQQIGFSYFVFRTPSIPC